MPWKFNPFTGQLQFLKTAPVTSVNTKTGAVVLSTTDVGEGSNLYHTDARTIAAPLTGFTSGAGTVAASDSVLQAFQKVNGNVALKAATGANADITSMTGITGNIQTGTSSKLGLGISPTYKLHLKASASAWTEGICLESPGSAATRIFEMFPDTNSFVYARRNGETYYTWVIDNVGKFGVGKASPAAQLHVAPRLSSVVVLAVQALSGQSVDLVQYQDSSGTATSGVYSNGIPYVPTYTVAGLPSAVTYTRGLVFVSNEVGGACLAFSDGTNWRRVTDRAIVA